MGYPHPVALTGRQYHYLGLLPDDILKRLEAKGLADSRFAQVHVSSIKRRSGVVVKK